MCWAQCPTKSSGTVIEKTNKVQKNEIKQLTNENDKLRRDIHRHTGLCRFTEPTPNSSVSDEITTAGTHKSDGAKCQLSVDWIANHKQIFYILKYHVLHVSSQIGNQFSDKYSQHSLSHSIAVKSNITIVN